MNFENSLTKENLMRAFAGESQAKNRYLFSADVAKQQNLHVIELVFKYTAGQEKAHAKVFFDYLKEVNGENVNVDAKYPVDNYTDIIQLLRSSEHNEFEEFSDAYKSFSEVAKSEGFTNISNTFDAIAKIEKTHSDRFGELARLMENNILFENDTEIAWICLNCGNIHYGKKAPGRCPVCHYPQGYFLRNNLALFS